MTIHYLGKRPGYWKAYHLSKKIKGKEKFKLLLGVCRKLGQPWKKSRRGRKPIFEPYEHAAIFIYMVLCGYSYRDMEEHILEVMDRTIDHSTIGKMAKRISAEYIHRVLKLFFGLTDRLINVVGVYIPDSTGIGTDRCKVVKVVITKREKKKHIKWHIIAKYYPSKGIITIVSCCVGGEYSHDSPKFRRNLDSDVKNGPMFGDAGFDAEENFKECEKRSLFPVIRIRDPKNAKGIRKKFAKIFDENEGLYKQMRGIVEGIFGGTETKYGNRTRFRLDHTQNLFVICLGVKQNVNSYLMLIAYEKVFKENGGISYFFVVSIFVEISCDIYSFGDLFDNLLQFQTI